MTRTLQTFSLHCSGLCALRTGRAAHMSPPNPPDEIGGWLRKFAPAPVPCPPGRQGLSPWLGDGDGFGSQFLRFVSVLGVALSENRTFCTHPGQRMQHGVDGHAMQTFVGGRIYGPPATNGTQSLRSASPTFAFHPRTRRRARSYYRSPSKPRPRLYDPLHFNVAIHVRRGDVSSRHRNSSRFIADEDYLRCIANLSRVLRGRAAPVYFHIFSDGAGSSLRRLVANATALL
eukprot:1970668-Prymnesium_polylepis.1